jgi:methylmalonyl-CoA/ethylmalonyl-CoA epimerase
LHHYAVGVSDLDRAIEWYGRVLDFELERRFGVPESATQIAHLVDPNGVRIELLARGGSTAGPDATADPFASLLVQGAKHIGFLVDDVDAAWSRLRERGAEAVAEPATVEPAGVRNCFVRDPDGTIVEFDQWL